jgi:hypothetical protein
MPDQISLMGDMVKNKTQLSVPEKHQLKIARDTMKMTCVFCAVMGGMSHIEAGRLLNVPLPKNCTCKAGD